MGEVKKVDEYLSTASEGNEGPQPVEVASRVVAHLAHRVPLAKKITKRFEGRDKSSGIFSDIGILLAQLVSRNEELITEQGIEVISSIVNAPKSSPARQGEHVEFGPVDPIAKSNNGGN
jgi:hypothetical protein